MLEKRRGRLAAGRLASYGFVLVLIPAGLLVVAVAGSLATYRATRAAQGQGTRGYFVSADGALGEFKLPGGKIARRDVTFSDPPPQLGPGTVIPALDTGDATYVFPRHGSTHWVTDVGLMSLVLVGFGAWAWFAPLRPARRRRRRRRALLVAAARSSPVWQSSEFPLLSGDVVTRRVNTALRGAGDKASYPILVRVGVRPSDADRAMYPVIGESPRLAELTTTITDFVGDHGVLAAVAAGSKDWIFLIYTATTEWLRSFGAAVQSAVTDREVMFGANRDPRWRAFRDLQWAMPRRARDPLLVLAGVPLLFALFAARYGIAWAAGSFLAITAWVTPILIRLRRPGGRDRLIAYQVAHPARAFVMAAAITSTLLFPLGVAVVHPSSPSVCAAGAAVLALAIVGALWPAQLRFYARMRARDDLRKAHGLLPSG